MQTATLEETAGQKFIKNAKRVFKIGPSTKRFRRFDNMIDLIGAGVKNARYHPGYYSLETTEAFAPALNVIFAWEKHVDCRRLDGAMTEILLQIRPYRFIWLVGAMIDAGVTNVSEAEGWFRENRTMILGLKKA